MHLHQIPMHRAHVAVGRVVVAGAGSEMYGAGDLFVKEDVPYRAVDVWIEPE